MTPKRPDPLVGQVVYGEYGAYFLQWGIRAAEVSQRGNQARVPVIQVEYIRGRCRAIHPGCDGSIEEGELGGIDRKRISRWVAHVDMTRSLGR
mgnify:CR=1 FL=1